MALAGLVLLRGLLPRSLDYALNRWTPGNQAIALQNSSAVRVQLLKTGLHIWSEHPMVGIGPGNYPETLDQYQLEVQGSVRGHIEELIQKRVKNLQRRPERVRHELDRIGNQPEPMSTISGSRLLLSSAFLDCLPLCFWESCCSGALQQSFPLFIFSGRSGPADGSVRPQPGRCHLPQPWHGNGNTCWSGLGHREVPGGEFQVPRLGSKPQ